MSRKRPGKTRKPKLEPQEIKRRRREFATLISLGLLFLILTWVEFRLFGMSRELPFVHSIFFFGLVNFNIILFLLMVFLIFRNIVKNFAERQGGVIGSTLKSKLIAAFVGFSVVPTALMFLVSVFYINNSFDKWFSEKMSGVLKSSLEVTNAHYRTAKKKNYHFAHEIREDLKKSPPVDLKQRLEILRSRYSLDALEYYPGMFSDPVVVVSKSDPIPEPPPVALEFRKKGIAESQEASLIHHFRKGNLIRVIIPVPRPGGPNAAIVASTFVPLSLISRMDDIALAYDEFRNVDPLAYPLKSIYLIILVLMTLLILLGATWFGFYLAKQLSIPLEELASASKKISKGAYPTVERFTGSPEINQLVDNFNTMSRHLESSQKEVKKANKKMRQTLSTLDEHSKYVDVVLSNVTTGVVSLDNRGQIATINHHAAKLLNINTEKYVGQKLEALLKGEQYAALKDLFAAMKVHKAEKIKREVNISVDGQSVPIQMTVSVLYDENGKEQGKVLVFDDLTMVINAQRAAAWTEVARRIAHEIKNPLTPIKLAAQRLQRKFSAEIDDPAFLDCVTMITDQTDDLKALVNEFSQFARMPKSRPVMADLHDVITQSMSLFRQAHKNTKFDLQLDAHLPNFMFDPDHLKRAVTNLVDNAVAAVKNESYPRVSLETKYDEMLKLVSISVADNGPGIPKHMQSRIFEPYVTSKKHGTGLGLAIVKRTVEDHNGYIRAFPNGSRGTKIVIELPVLIVEQQNKILKTVDQVKDVRDEGAIT